MVEAMDMVRDGPLAAVGLIEFIVMVRPVDVEDVVLEGPRPLGEGPKGLGPG